MENQRDVLSVIYRTHAELNEKLTLLKNLVFVLDKNGLWKDESEVLDFLNKNVVEHFENEEKMISMLKNKGLLSPDDEPAVSKILSEHKTLLEEFQGLVITAGMTKGGGRQMFENFIKFAQEIFESLVKHAGYEDETLYKIAREKLSDEYLTELDRLIGR